MKFKNIIILVADALRASNLGCYGYKSFTSPNIDKLTRQASLFNNVYASSANTDPAFTSIITGLYPAAHGILYHANMIPEEQTKKIEKIRFLQEILGEAGYRTCGIDFLGRWHKRSFDHYIDSDDSETKNDSGILKVVEAIREVFRIRPGTRLQSIIEKTPLYDFLLGLSFKDDGTTPYAPADKISDTCIRFLEDAHDNPCYIFAHFWDTHQPYMPPEKYRNEIDSSFYEKIYPNLDKDLDYVMQMSCTPLQKFFLKKSFRNYKSISDIIKSYDGEIRFIDHQIGRIISWLEENHQIDDSLIIITADHGENLTEKEIFFSHELITPGVLKIPLLIYAPGEQRKSFDDALIQPIDIFPTVLDLSGIDNPYMRNGISVFSSAITERKEAFCYNYSLKRSECTITDFTNRYYTSLADPDVCTYCKKPHKPAEELYNIMTDPMETQNLIGSNLELARGMKRKMQSAIRNHKDWSTKEDQVIEMALDRDEVRSVEKRLRALGYY